MTLIIMDTFVYIKKYISNNLIEQIYINNQVIKNTEDIRLLQESFDKLSNKDVNSHIFFEGQIYDAYSLMKDIFNTSKINKRVTIITNKYNNEDYDKYQIQYHNIKLIISNSFHDRFIIIDRKMLYHSGSSFKDLGKKCFAITKIEDSNYLNELLKYIK